jgi:hypothetical protein
MQLEHQPFGCQDAFLHGELHEQIFMHQPKGFVEPRKEQLFCKLKKALYGLNESP